MIARIDHASATRPLEAPYIVGLGGTFSGNSTTEKTLRAALRAAEELGARTTLLSLAGLDLPMYTPDTSQRSRSTKCLLQEIRKADGLILASPAYHGSVSGLLKNAIDYVEDLSKEAPPYFQDRGIGLIATGAGWQGAVMTLAAMRDIVHALRGWPTPLGIAVNSAEPAFDMAGRCLSAKLQEQLRVLARQVVDFAVQRHIVAHQFVENSSTQSLTTPHDVISIG